MSTVNDIRNWLAAHTFNEEGPINLDDMAQSDLEEFMLFGEGDRMAIAEVCFPAAPFGLAMLTVDRLMTYAEAKLLAISNRLDGNIRLAIRLERRCDAIYEGLPEFARW